MKLTVIPANVDPLGALHHTRPLQHAVVGLPLQLMLDGSYIVLRFGVRQISCNKNIKTKTNTPQLVMHLCSKLFQESRKTADLLQALELD